ncbi:MAG TPA: cytochrome c3 family protein [Candidatus Sulfomarinibacteraceae bacterium]|nr:cytochrome c3 family protein [Candidatus Sulfomarinibacteraceae bacterium]
MRALPTICLYLLAAGLLALAACRAEEAGDEPGLSNQFLGDPELGAEALDRYGCGSCHTIPGIKGADALVGAPLTAWSERHYIAGSLPNTPSNLVRWIMDPQEIEPGTLMPDLGVTEADARHMAAYLYTLGEGAVVGVAQTGEQPAPFSHRLHVADVGLDCRYCHDAVTQSAVAGMPSTHTCMTCHSQVWTESPLLQPVRESWETGAPLAWVRVQPLPEFVRFHHAAHVNNGVGCDECHGRVDQMEAVEPVVTMSMSWCLECHRQPQERLRPPQELFNLAWEAPPDQAARGAELAQTYGIRHEILTDCSICHQ